VALGTIHLAVLRERYLDYQIIYGEPDAKHTEHLQKLQAKIVLYRNAEKLSRERATAWRLEKLSLDQRTQGGLAPYTIWTVRDSYDGWSHEFNSNQGGSQNAAQQALEDRKTEVRSQFGADLDIFLAPARLWRYLDPTVTDKPVKVYREVTTGPVGGLSQYTQFNDDPHGQPVTKIVIYAGTRVDGLELFYGGKSGGFHGKTGGSRHEFDLTADEWIVDTWGRSGAALDAIYFETNKGRTLGAGGGGGAVWSAAPADHLNARLWKIFGRSGPGHVESVGFVWRFALEE
jgi:hypothetical protein